MRTVLIVKDGRLAAGIRSRLEEEGGFEVVADLESPPGAERVAAALRQWQADVVFVEVTGGGDGLRLLEAARLVVPEARCVACKRHLEGSEVVQLLRSGATDCYQLGMEASRFSEMAARIKLSVAVNHRRPRKEQLGRVVGFLSLKPGSGASTLAAQTAFALRRQGTKQVLLIDLNLASGSPNHLVGGKAGHLDVVTALAMRPEMKKDRSWIDRTLTWDGVRILPAPPVPCEANASALGAAIRELLAEAIRHFDWVVVDMPPAGQAGSATLAAGLEQLVVVSTPELASLHLALKRLDELKRAGCTDSTLRLALNRQSRKDLISKDRIARTLHIPVRWSFPDDYATLHAAGRSSITGGSALATGILRMARELANPGTECRSGMQKQAPAHRETSELAAAMAG
jgi:pilus assembly protein CpaE